MRYTWTTLLIKCVVNPVWTFPFKSIVKGPCLPWHCPFQIMGRYWTDSVQKMLGPCFLFTFWILSSADKTGGQWHSVNIHICTLFPCQEVYISCFWIFKLCSYDSGHCKYSKWNLCLRVILVRTENSLRKAACCVCAWFLVISKVIGTNCYFTCTTSQCHLWSIGTGPTTLLKL